MKRHRPSSVLAAALIAPLLAIPAAAPAQGKWKEIGATASGNAVYVDTRSVKRTGDLVAANVRVVFKEPVKGAKGTFASYRTSATFNCTKKSLAAKENVYYADAKSTRVVDRTVNKMPGFGPALGGSLGAVALNYLCAK
ncbi:MAG TPA: surface-adhesin E family protein [Gemmatimonadaceae bacterium]|nr:surface-adhesin E family protein [Gemmatimonadaceae bacterium]